MFYFYFCLFFVFFLSLILVHLSQDYLSLSGTARSLFFFFLFCCFFLFCFSTMSSKLTFRYDLGQKEKRKTEKNRKKNKQNKRTHGVSTLCLNACLLNTRSTIHNKLRKIDIDINVHRYNTLKGDIAKKYLFLLLWSLMITHIYIYCTV